MSTGARTPPRFVPTLTTVVEVPAEPEAPPAAETPRAAPNPPSAPPPMLDDLLPRAAPVAGPEPQPGKALRLSDEDAFRLEEELLHRVLQRVDLSLEERLTDTVSTAVQQQLDAMLPRLRDDIETVLRQLVVEALAQELSETPGRTPTV